jgi:N-formylglutamate deformylase
VNGNWLTIRRGDAPLVLSIPHAGVDIPPDIETSLVSPWLARKDTDWWLDRLYELVITLDATIVHTAISRTVIDVNRDPSGASLYPGHSTTELCPTTTFDGEPLYCGGVVPDAAEIERRRARWFVPYHEALSAELARLREQHGQVVLYDAHSIRSSIPRLFEGTLPHFNIGTSGGSSCALELTRAVEVVCDSTRFSRVTNGRFLGGWITRSHGNPPAGVHAMQMELACRSYLPEPRDRLDETNWPPAFNVIHARSMADALSRILRACVEFAAPETRGAAR